MSLWRLSETVPLVVLLVLIACSDGAAPLEQPPLAVQEGHTALSKAPGGVPFTEMMSFVNPCSGLGDQVTLMGTLWIQEHNGQTVIRSESTVTTTSGFEGQRTRTIVENGNVFKVALNAMLTNGSGEKIRIHFVQVFDLSAGTVRAQSGGAPTCLG